MQQTVPQIRIPPVSCKGGNEGKMVCTSEQCNQFSFMCIESTCKDCFEKHKHCKSYWLKGLNQKILKKRKLIPPTIEQSLRKMNTIYEKAIQKLQKDRENLANQIELYGLNQYETDFIILLSKNQPNAIKGSLISKVMQKIQIQFQFQQCEQAINRYWKRKEIDFEKIFQHFRKIWEKPLSKLPSVITNDLQVLQGFFEKRNIIEFELLYRASQNGFSAVKFHELCDGFSDTLIIAKTEYGKIIGGFTSMKWSTNRNYSNDTDGSTFLFSLSNRQKYAIKNQAEAIYCQPNYGPTFGGGHDFYIADNADTANSSYFNFGYTFNTNGKCQVDTQQAYTFFCGAPEGYNAIITEYEVFQVFFAD